MLSVFKFLFNAILEAVFPKVCFSCASSGSYFCNECIYATHKQDFQKCIMCQKPSLQGLTHPKCKTPYSPDRLISIYNYNTLPIKQLIISGKYQFVKDIFVVFGNIISNEIKSIDKINEYIICPLPLHIKRKRWRGFNQSEVLAKTISANLNISLNHSLVRNKATKVQKDLSKIARAKNVFNAFSVEQSENIKNKNIILIDDVTTTGMTLRAASKVLKRSGAKYIWCITIAQD